MQCRGMEAERSRFGAIPAMVSREGVVPHFEIKFGHHRERASVIRMYPSAPINSVMIADGPWMEPNSYATQHDDDLQ
jgi:hypothetical protein